jgi:hypothetical protein
MIWAAGPALGEMPRSVIVQSKRPARERQLPEKVPASVDEGAWAAHPIGGPTRQKASGGSFYFNKARDLGKGYVRSVARAHSRALIDSTTAAEYLDVKVGQIPRLAEASGA